MSDEELLLPARDEESQTICHKGLPAPCTTTRNSENFLPLFPSPTFDHTASNLKLDPVLREIFRPYLQKEVPDYRFKKINQFIDNYREHCNKIKAAEQELMIVQAKNLILSDEQSLSPTQICDVKKKTANNFNLYKISDVVKNAFYKDSDSEATHECTHFDDLNNDCADCSNVVFHKRSLAKTYLKPKQELSISLEPKEVVFKDFIIGNSYSKSVKLRNTSEQPIIFNIIPPKKNHCLKLSCFPKLGDRLCFLSPGLSVEIKITFDCTCPSNFKETFTVQVENGPSRKVKIKGLNTPPVLMTQNYFGVDTNRLTRQDLAHVQMIDCGVQLIGSKRTYETTVFNTGAPATFFVLAEGAWVYANLTEITLEDELKVKPFSIQPCYFTLGTMESQTLRISFQPECTGFSSEMVYIVCDNLTYRVIDLLGDGFSFDTNFVELDEDVGKKFPINVEDDRSTNFYIDFGTSTSTGKLEKTVFVQCTSPAPLKYHWATAPTNISRTVRIPNHTLSVVPSDGLLFPNHTQAFKVICRINDYHPGNYRAMLVLVIDEVSKLSLPEDFDPNLLIQKTSSQDCEECYSISMRKLEVWFKVEKTTAVLKSHYKHISVELVPEVFKIEVVNPSVGSVLVSWNPNIQSKHTNIYFKRSIELISPGESKIFEVTVEPVSSGSELVEIRATVENDHTISFWLKTDVESTVVIPPKPILSLGCKSIRESENVLLHAGARCSEEPKPLMSMFTFNLSDKDNPYITPRQVYDPQNDFKQDSLLGVASGNIFVEPDPGGDMDVQYYFGIMKFEFNNIMCSRIILSEFRAPKVTLHPTVVNITKPLYVTVPTEFYIVITNSSKVENQFEWKNCLGADADFVQTSIQPISGVLPKKSSVTVVLTLTPIQEGLISDLTAVCEIKGSGTSENLPIINGNVEGLSYLIKCDDLKCLWTTQPKFSRGSDESLSACEDQTERVTTPTNTLSEISSEITWEAVQIDKEVECTALKYVDSLTSSLPYSAWPLISGKFTSHPLSQKIQRSIQIFFKDHDNMSGFNYYSASQENLEEATDFYIMNFNIPVKKVFTKDIFIRNITPISSVVQADIDNFFVCNNKTENKITSAKILNNKLIQEGDRLWADRIQTNTGLVIKLEHREIKVDGEEEKIIRLELYGTLWGKYFDCLSLQNADSDEYNTSVGQCVPLKIPLSVVIDEYPVCFTFDPDSSTPHFKFGTLRPKSTTTRNVFLRNKTFLTLKVVFITYGPEPHPHTESSAYWCLPMDPVPFTVHLELHPKSEKDFCRLHLLEYMGEQQSYTFSLTPNILYLEPYETKQISIKVNTVSCAFDLNQLTNELIGKAFGIVYIENSPSEALKSCYRNDGYDLKPFELNLSATVEIPIIRWCNSSTNALRFETSVTKVMQSENNFYEDCRTLIFENTGKVTASLTISADTPFYISDIRHPNVNLVKEAKGLKRFVDVPPNHLIEVDVSLALTPTEFDKSESHTRKFWLLLRQEDLVTQYIKLSYNLLYNEFKFTPEGPIAFGLVYIGCTSVLTRWLTVKNNLGSEPYKIEVRPNSEFSVIPKSGLIKGAHDVVEVQVSYTPRSCVNSTEIITICGLSSLNSRQFLLLGRGTWDHKYYVQNKFNKDLSNQIN